MARTRGNQRQTSAARAVALIACLLGVSAGSATADTMNLAERTSGVDVGVLGQGFRLLGR